MQLRAKPKVFITRPVPAAIQEKIAAVCEVTSNPQDRLLPREELAAGLADCAGALCFLTDRMDAAIIEQAGSLRIIANVAVGYDNIDVAAATKHGVMVSNTPGVLTDTTADFAFALLLAAARRVTEGERFVRAGQWKEWRFDLLLGTDVHHSTLGIFGLGGIGRAMARRAGGFGMKILYAAPKRAPEEIERALGAAYVSKETLLRESDFISLHVPLNAETRHLIGAPELSQMKPTAFLINTARGPVVDENALAAALRESRIAGAGLDVFEDEPRVNQELLVLPTAVLAPHIASASRQTRFRMMELAAENLVCAASGGVAPNLVNRELAGAS